MVFVATAASIVSGTLAERIKLWPFLIFTVVLTGFIYPIAGSWQWGAGWLSEMGFSDFAGSTLVHSVGGWAALVGAIILGARKGKYGTDVPFTRCRALPCRLQHSVPSSCGSAGSASTVHPSSQWAPSVTPPTSPASSLNTNMAAAAGVVAAVILTQVMYKKVDVTMALNGALAGLVSITAEPLAPSVWQAVFIGAIGGVIVVFTVPLLDKLKIDDVVGAIPVHLIAGIWGTLIVPLSNDGASYGTQIVGIVSYGVFTLVASGIVWFILKAAMGIRVSEEEEALGLDKVEVGVEAYPEFGTGSQRM
jgi:Amt family ammonium transporter